MIKAIYLDFDGTTYSHSQNSIPESAATALKKAQDKGVQIVLATGRSKSELKLFNMSGLEFDGYIVNNGQAIFDRNSKLLYINPLKGRLFDKMMEYYNEKVTPIMLCTTEEMYINIHNEHVRKVQASINTPLPLIKEYDGEDIIMASAFMNDEKVKEDLFTLSDIAELTYWNQGAIDIVPKGSSKAKGIEIYNAYLNITKEECMGIGDGDNDIEMLKHCGISVAMGNSIEEVKELADYVTDHIDNDGMLNALKHYNLI